MHRLALLAGVEYRKHRHGTAVVVQAHLVPFLDAKLSGVLGVDAADGLLLELLHVVNVVPLGVGAGAHVLAADNEGVLLADRVSEVCLTRGLPVACQLFLGLVEVLAHLIVGLGVFAIELCTLAVCGKDAAFSTDRSRVYPLHVLLLADHLHIDAVLLAVGGRKPQVKVVVVVEVEVVAIAHGGAQHLVDFNVGLALVHRLDGFFVPQQVGVAVVAYAQILVFEPVAGGQQDVGIQGGVVHGDVLDDNKLQLLHELQGLVLLGLV